ncbi:unnamed protein product [Choristocarpus tenellus]
MSSERKESQNRPLVDSRKLPIEKMLQGPWSSGDITQGLPHLTGNNVGKVEYDPGFAYSADDLDPYRGLAHPLPTGRVPPLPEQDFVGDGDGLPESLRGMNSVLGQVGSLRPVLPDGVGVGSAQAEAASKYGEELRAASEQAQSLIYHLKRFNNWVKATLISKASKEPEQKGLRVLDLACGKGGDLGKWAAHPDKVERYVASDIAYGSLEHLIERMKGDHLLVDRWRKTPVLLFEADLGKHDAQRDILKVWKSSWTSSNGLEGTWENAVPLSNEDIFDVVSMQFALHYMAQTEERMRHFLHQVSRRLRHNGIFVATTMDSRVLVQLLMGHAEDTWDPIQGRNALTLDINDERDENLLHIAFAESRESYVRQDCFDSDRRGPFGLEYTFALRETELNKNAVDDVPEWMLPLEVLKVLAAENNLELETAQNFHEFYTNEVQHAHSKKLLVDMHVFNPEGTMNATEWRIAGMYMALIFRKTSEKGMEGCTGTVLYDHPPSPEGDPPGQEICASPEGTPPSWQGPPPKFRPHTPDHPPPGWHQSPYDEFVPKSPEGPPPELDDSEGKV